MPSRPVRARSVARRRRQSRCSSAPLRRRRRRASRQASDRSHRRAFGEWGSVCSNWLSKCVDVADVLTSTSGREETTSTNFDQAFHGQPKVDCVRRPRGQHHIVAGDRLEAGRAHAKHVEARRQSIDTCSLPEDVVSVVMAVVSNLAPDTATRTPATGRPAWRFGNSSDESRVLRQLSTGRPRRTRPAHEDNTAETCEP